MQVREYILIGEAEGGICGEQGTTWGSHWHPCFTDVALNTEQLGGGRRCDGAHALGCTDAVVHQGFVRVNLPALSALQVCCSDERWQCSTNSRTVSFRRRT